MPQGFPSLPARVGASKKGTYKKLDTFERDDDDHYDDNDDFIMSAVRSQQELMNAQDESLDQLGQAAGRLGVISMEISNELNEQNKMLDEMEVDLERADDNLAIVTKKTQDLIKKSGGCKYFSIIAVLSLVVVILFFLIIYT